MNKRVSSAMDESTCKSSKTLEHSGPVTTYQCPNCNHSHSERFFHIPSLPVNVGVFYDDHQTALNAPTAPISLTFCSKCKLVHNQSFDRNAEIFKPGYEVSLKHSQTFQNFIKGVAERLVDRFDLQEKKITEIGCGDAYFLEQLAALGGNECTGIDPTVVVEGIKPAGLGSIRLIREYFSNAHCHLESDFICCLSVFEDIPKIQEFLANVRLLALRNNAPLYFEVFNGWRSFVEREVWSVHYEQCNYFSLESIQNVFRENGFIIKNADTCYAGDQYLFVEAFADPVISETNSTKQSESALPEILRTYTLEFESKCNRWTGRFSEYHSQNKKVVLWGTGGKGITFLNSVPGAEIIELVAEINPDKHGKYLPGTGQKIIPPDALAEIQPDIIIITNAVYESEMKKQAKNLNVNAAFLVA